jgi:hypothetical protein
MQKEYYVQAIHGEGDRDTVNDLQCHRNDLEVRRLQQAGQPVPSHLTSMPDEPPDVIVVLRDPHHNHRIELPLETWDEVQRWKTLAGYDHEKRHWKHGAKVLVRFGTK